MALYVFKSAVRMSNGPKDVLKAVGNRVGALMAEPGEPATFRIGPLTFQTSIGTPHFCRVRSGQGSDGRQLLHFQTIERTEKHDRK